MCICYARESKSWLNFRYFLLLFSFVLLFLVDNTGTFRDFPPPPLRHSRSVITSYSEVAWSSAAWS